MRKNHKKHITYGLFTITGGAVGWRLGVLANAKYQIGSSSVIAALTNMNITLAAREGALAIGADYHAAELAGQMAKNFFSNGMNSADAATHAAFDSTIFGKVAEFFKGNASPYLLLFGSFIGFLAAWYLFKSPNEEAIKKEHAKQSDLDSKIVRLQIENKALQIEIKTLMEQHEKLHLERKLQLSEGAPDEMICPISKLIMDDPVRMIDDHCYERNYIILWYKKSKKSPLIPSLTLYDPTYQLTDFELQAKIQDYVKNLKKGENNPEVLGHMRFR